MLNVRDNIMTAVQSGDPVILATIVKVEGSSPSPLGTSMVLVPTRRITDLVSGDVTEFTASSTLTGGCIEAAVMEVAQDVLTTGVPVRESFGISDSDAFAVGLMCGGRVAVLVQRIDDSSTELAKQLERGEVAIVVDGSRDWLGYAVPQAASGDQTSGIARQLSTVVASAITDGTAKTTLVECDGVTLTLLTASDSEPPRMYIFGAVDYAAALSTMASTLGYNVVVCDPRETFTTPARFPDARVIVQWPHRYLAEEIALGHIDATTAVCILTHDLKFDIPLLALAVSSAAGYIGAMGSRRTQTVRKERLIANGMSEADWLRIHAPIGLDLGAATPQETAVSILAEVIAAQHTADGKSLSVGDGPIHASTVVAADHTNER